MMQVPLKQSSGLKGKAQHFFLPRADFPLFPCPAGELFSVKQQASAFRAYSHASTQRGRRHKF